MVNPSTISSFASAIHLRGYLSGLTLSTAGSSTTFSVAVGVAVDDAQTDWMNLGSSISKTTSAWAVGSAAGALDTGTIATGTWYHVYLIKRLDTQVVDVLISLSASAPTMPANYTIKRRIGSMKTDGSSNWVLFIQNGDTFLWNTPITDVNNSTQGTTNTGYTLTVPSGVLVQAMFNCGAGSSSASPFAIIHSPLTANQTANSPTGNISILINGTGLQSYGPFSIYTTNAQVRVQASATFSFFQIATSGWVDTRGKL